MGVFNLYLVRNLIDGSMYVGKTTKTIAHRWSHHLWMARYGKGRSHLHRAMRKYGAENFVVDPLVLTEDIIDEQHLNEGERLMIRLLRINCRLYNLTDGGDGVSGWKFSGASRRWMSEFRTGKAIHSEQYRRELRQRNLGNTYNLGVKRSDETLRKMSDALKGRTISAEHRQLISKSMLGHINSVGEKNASAKMTTHRVQELRFLAGQGKSLKQLGEMFGITKSNAGFIVQRKTWANVPDVSSL